MPASSIATLVTERLLRIQDQSREGKKVVGFFPGNFVPEEVIYASGALPVCLIQGGNTAAAEIGLTVMPQMLCPYARSLIGGLSQPQNPFFPKMDLVVAPLTCQHLKKVAEVWEYEGAANVFKLGVPFQHDNDFERTYFADRINDLLDTLEALTGREITRERLQQAIKAYNGVREGLHRISLLRRSPDIDIPAREFIALNHLSYLVDPLEMTVLLETAFDQYKNAAGRISTPDGPRILLMGPNLGFGDDKILQIVDDAGGKIVIEEFCEGLRQYERSIEDDGDLVLALVKGYLIDRLPCAFMRDSAKRRLDNALALIDDFKVDGVIWYELTCCETYDSEAYYFSREMEEHGIPFLVLESDYTSADVGQLRTRIEAFFEIVKGVI